MGSLVCNDLFLFTNAARKRKGSVCFMKHPRVTQNKSHRNPRATVAFVVLFYMCLL